MLCYRYVITTTKRTYIYINGHYGIISNCKYKYLNKIMRFFNSFSFSICCLTVSLSRSPTNTASRYIYLLQFIFHLLHSWKLTQLKSRLPCPIKTQFNPSSLVSLYAVLCFLCVIEHEGTYSLKICIIQHQPAALKNVS